MKKIINHFIVLFIGAVIIAPSTGCDGGGGGGVTPPAPCTAAQIADPANKDCYKLYTISATVATFVLGPNPNVICASATPTVSITFTSAGVTAATFATAYPKGIIANIAGVPTLNTVGSARPNPNIAIPVTILAALLTPGTLTLTAPLPVSANQTGTGQSFARGETYDVTMQLVDGNNAANTFNFAGATFKINVQ